MTVTVQSRILNTLRGVAEECFYDWTVESDTATEGAVYLYPAGSFNASGVLTYRFFETSARVTLTNLIGWPKNTPRAPKTFQLDFPSCQKEIDGIAAAIIDLYRGARTP